MTASDAIEWAQAWLATLERGKDAGYAEWHEVADDLACLGPASVDLAWRLYVGHVWQCDLEPDNCLDCTALADWADVVHKGKEATK